jgi:type IX secretion system PorP/SprF family membrane protein
MRKVLLSVGLIVCSAAVFGQQDPQFTHFMFDRLSINPAVAGTNEAICATTIYRNQWNGFAGQPNTFLLNVQAPINPIHGGLGITFFNDQIGFERNNIARLSYSYHLGLGPGTLGIGAAAGMVSKSINDPAWITPDGTPYTDDGAIPGNGEKQSVVDFSFGVFYKTNNLYMGLSSTHLSESEVTAVNISMARHYYVIAGYDYAINGGQFTIRPSVFAKSDAASTQIDLNCNVLYNNMVWLGVSYRMQDAIAPMVGYQKELGKGMLKIGYSYDVTTSEISNYSSGSHEIMLNYCFNIDPPPVIQKSKNVRFL